MKTIFISGLAGLGMAWMVILVPAQSNRENPPKMPDINVSVQHFDKEPEIKYPWGSIRWMMNSAIDHESAQTFGICRINPGASQLPALPSQLRRDSLCGLGLLQTHCG
jgi:hypothetical protein